MVFVKRNSLTHFDASVYESLPERKEEKALAAGIFPFVTAGVAGPGFFL